MSDAPRPLTDGPVTAFMRRRRDRLGRVLVDTWGNTSADIPHPVLTHAVSLVRERLADMRLPEGPRLVIDPLGGLAPSILQTVWPTMQVSGPAAAAVLADAFPVNEMGMSTRETFPGRGAQTDGPKGRGLLARIVERVTDGLSGGGRRDHKRSGGMYAPSATGRFEGVESGSQSAVIDLGGLAVGWSLADWFAEMARLLAPGGLYLCLSPGPTTLADLWMAWGRSVPASPFWHDLHDLGDAMAAAGLAAPVAESERLRLTYTRSLSALRDLRNFPLRTGGDRAEGVSGLMGQGQRRDLFAALESQRDTQGRIVLSVECVLTHAWKPTPQADAPARSGEARAVPVQWHRPRTG